ncbi:MAG TPA: hypothetical protein VF266_15075 [Thermoanaerobaculia bacterium]
MDGVFIHSTPVLMAILRSRMLLGTHKVIRGDELDEALRRGTVKDSECRTFFVKWQHESLAFSLSRLKPKPRDVRAVLGFTDPSDNMVHDAAYPCVVGRQVPITALSLRVVVVNEDDLPGAGTTIQEVMRLIDGTGAKGRGFSFFWTDSDGIRDERVIDAKFKEAVLHGVLS